MPQMSPMNWILLFIFFFMIFLMINMLNYYIFSLKMNFTKKNFFIKKNINWKW